MVAFCCDDLFGLEGLGEARGDGFGEALAAEGLGDFDLGLAADAFLLFADLATELGVFLFAGLAGLTGVLKPASESPAVKLCSLIGETEDLLLVDAADFFVDCDFIADARLDLVAEAVVFFFIEAGVVLGFDDFGLGVPLIGFDARLAGVGVCLAILLNQSVFVV